METLRELYRIGPGPSSSHTLAPQNACKLFKERFPEVLSFDAELFGSLALTGEGHSTDKVITDTFAPRQCRITFNINRQERFPNGLILRGYDEFNQLVASWTVYSLGGGAFSIEEEKELHLNDEVYPANSMNEILEDCARRKISLGDYAFVYEPEIEKYLNEVLSQMLKTVRNGLEASGILPGRLQVERVAKSLYLDAQTASEAEEKNRLSLMAYAYAACEENASGHICVTAPTMGASGIIAALVYYFYYDANITRSKLIKALAVAGLFGNVVKKNATISGAIGGCQAEIGTACAMASAMVAYIDGAKNNIIAYAAEVGMEHNLGLTCDPVGGYVIIPCIERNAVATLRAIDNAFLAQRVGRHKANKVSFDDIVRTMNYTGRKLPIELKETSLGGLATEINVAEPFKKEVKVKEDDVIETKPVEKPVIEKTTIESINEELNLKEEIRKLINEPAEEKEDTEEMKAIKDSSLSEETSIKPIAEPIVEDVVDIELEKTGEFKVSDFDLDLVSSWSKIK